MKFRHITLVSLKGLVTKMYVYLQINVSNYKIKTFGLREFADPRSMARVFHTLAPL